jgi:ribosomal protein S18 acetylase RimI-like enzyme
MHVESLTPTIEGSFIKFLQRDVVANFYGLLDLKRHRDKAKFWVALEGDEILGYLLEFNEKALTIRGDVRCTAELLKRATLTEPSISIKPDHLPIVKQFYESVRPLLLTDHKISALLSMEVDRSRFKPVIKYRPRKLTVDEYDAVGKLSVKFHEELGHGIYPPSPERMVETLKKGRLVYGIFEGSELVSYACGGPNPVAEDLTHVAPVYTSPKFRGRGYATSICSALVDELLNKSEKARLGVSQNNPAALRVYKKIGFTETGHKFLAFWGRKIA